jgi:hypothetical protein
MSDEVPIYVNGSVSKHYCWVIEACYILHEWPLHSPEGTRSLFHILGFSFLKMMALQWWSQINAEEWLKICIHTWNRLTTMNDTWTSHTYVLQDLCTGLFEDMPFLAHSSGLPMPYVKLIVCIIFDIVLQKT